MILIDPDIMSIVYIIRHSQDGICAFLTLFTSPRDEIFMKGSKFQESTLKDNV